MPFYSITATNALGHEGEIFPSVSFRLQCDANCARSRSIINFGIVDLVSKNTTFLKFVS